MTQLFEAINYLHRNRICHRDLKPDNILVTQESDATAPNKVKIKLIDFNVSVKLEDENSKVKGPTGLKEWSAPETRLKYETDLKIDCWTLGCVMFFLCTGEQPFERHDKIEITPEFNLKQKLMDYCESNYFNEMVDFISNLLVNDPDARLSSIQALSHPWIVSAE